MSSFACRWTTAAGTARSGNYPERRHFSFNTTFNVLEGLRECAAAGNADPAEFRGPEARALEFMLAHKMYRSHRTGERR
jgi:hypothetical protein